MDVVTLANDIQFMDVLYDALGNDIVCVLSNHLHVHFYAASILINYHRHFYD